MKQIKINGEWMEGVMLGEGDINTLEAPLTAKEYLSNESRLEHGMRVVLTGFKAMARTHTLTFTISGTDKATFLANKQRFFSALYEQYVTLEIPKYTDKTYHLVYTGKSVSYNEYLSRTFCSVTAQFEEPNPTDNGIGTSSIFKV